jgi:hypothetical protein
MTLRSSTRLYEAQINQSLTIQRCPLSATTSKHLLTRFFKGDLWLMASFGFGLQTSDTHRYFRLNGLDDGTSFMPQSLWTSLTGPSKGTHSSDLPVPRYPSCPPLNAQKNNVTVRLSNR